MSLALTSKTFYEAFNNSKSLVTELSSRLLIGLCKASKLEDLNHYPRVTIITRSPTEEGKFSSDDWKKIVPFLKNIQRLDLYNQTKLSDRDFQLLSQHCTKLKTLNITNSSEPYKIYNLNISEILKANRELEELDLGGCLKLDDFSLYFIEQYGPNLKNLRLFGLDKITNPWVDRVFEKCKKLEYLSLRCTTIDPNTLYFPPQLKRLSLPSINQLTKEGMERLVKSCPQLTHLLIRGYKISNESLQYLLDNLKSLTYIEALLENDSLLPKLKEKGISFCDMDEEARFKRDLPSNY